METSEAKQKAINILTGAGYNFINGQIIEPKGLDYFTAFSVKNELSELLFYNAQNQECVFEIRHNSDKLILELIENEI